MALYFDLIQRKLVNTTGRQFRLMYTADWHNETIVEELMEVVNEGEDEKRFVEKRNLVVPEFFD